MSRHLALSHVSNVLHSLNFVSVSLITISVFFHFLFFFSPRLTVLFTFRSETSIHFGLGTTVFYFLPCCHVTDFTEAFSVCYRGGFILINTVWF